MFVTLQHGAQLQSHKDHITMTSTPCRMLCWAAAASSLTEGQASSACTNCCLNTAAQTNRQQLGWQAALQVNFVSALLANNPPCTDGSCLLAGYPAALLRGPQRHCRLLAAALTLALCLPVQAAAGGLLGRSRDHMAAAEGPWCT
jgi:hypothetical protein